MRYLSIALVSSLGFAAHGATTVGNVDGVSYFTFTPAGLAPGSPLVIGLHGCYQLAGGLAMETGLNRLAEKYGFSVLYPEQTYFANAMKCWNWYSAENQVRDGHGELQAIVKMIDEVPNVDRSRVYAMGMSAGGVMASNLATCYPDVFAGVGIHSGLPFKSNLLGTTERRVRAGLKCSGNKLKPVAVSIFHGTEDPFVPYSNSADLADFFVQYNRAAGADVRETPTVTLGNAGYSYQQEDYGMVQRILVDKLGHMWSGADMRTLFSDTEGPSATETMWLFLNKNSR